MNGFTSLPPLSLFVHIPWCVRKCPYCDFNSHEAKQELPEHNYIEALLRDLEGELPRVWGRTVYSIFIGGGTPSLFSPDGIDAIIKGVRARLPVSAMAEITLEANPGTVDQDRFAGFRSAGVNRLSIGIQAFSPPLLQRIGRVHDGEQAKRAVVAAQEAGFDNINLDLMYGLPDQTIATAVDDVTTAIAFRPQHISFYQLTLEPNTAFAHTPPVLPDEDAIWNMQNECLELLAANGYRQYEVSAFAAAGHACRHNLNYWQFGDYLGIGAGAHGKISDASTQSVTRYWKKRHPRDYMSSPVMEGSRRLTPDDLVIEFMMNALRLTEGFNVELLTERTGLPFKTLEKPLSVALDGELITLIDDCIRPTIRGRRFLNNLVELFLATKRCA